jgi:teichuronic acid biosynthesis glycosyltransferase TuaH
MKNEQTILSKRVSVPDIVMFTLSRWDNPYSSTALSIAKEFSKKTRVFYIDNPFTIKDLIATKRDEQLQRRKKALLFRQDVYKDIGQSGQPLITFAAPLVLPMNFLPAGKLYNLISKINNWILFAAIKRMMKRFRVHDFIFINVFNPFYCLDFPSFFKPRLFIYYTMDDIAHSRYVYKHGTRLEGEAMQKACFTLATSRELETMALARSKQVHYLPNGVDHSIFLTDSFHEKPHEFEIINTPIIVFIGNCDHRLDYDLIKKLLAYHKNKTLVMVGPHSIEERYIDELRAFPNILIIGRKEPNEIPHYLNNADCLIIPYKCNTLTKSIYPLKLNEYLASGKPVVSTPFSRDVKNFNEVVLLSESPDDFCEKVTLAIENDDEEKRKQRKKVAFQNKWEDRANAFWEIVSMHMN